jgi:protein-tyrosine phosphatase
MEAEIYSVDVEPPGHLSIVGRPRGGDWLADEMGAVREAGVDVLVSALTPAEERELDLTGEEEAATKVGLAFISMPIADRGVPTLDSTVVGIFKRLSRLVAEGKHIAVHCRMGIGRSSLVIATLLAIAGEDVDAAFDLLARARGLPVPDTPDQRSWVRTALASLRE